MNITVNGKVSYQLQQGIVLGDKFLNKEDFTEAFRSMLNNSEGYINLRYNLAQAKKIISIIQKGKGTRTITEFTSDLEAISRLFSSFMGGLGGEISLLTTFNIGKKSAQTYFLVKEEDLPSQLDEMGKKTYLNTLQALKQSQLGIDKLKQLNDALKSHLNGFYGQLTNSNIQSEDDYQRMRVWSYYNMKNRYNKDEHRPVSLGRYFWGRGHIQGYAAEAFGTHLSLVHPNALMGEHISNLKKSVISEHGGPGSLDLFNLLASAKGNISSQLSGDIVLVDDQGRLIFNIQSKASKYGAYAFTITYQKFLQNMMLFLDIYDKYISNPRAIEEADIDTLFKAFSTNAWAPISAELNNRLNEEMNALMQQGIP